MAIVRAVHTFTLRGLEQPRKARVEVVDNGRVIARGAWEIMPAGVSVKTTVVLSAGPGEYGARQATNVGDNIYENLVTVDLGSFEHPPSA